MLTLNSLCPYCGAGLGADVPAEHLPRVGDLGGCPQCRRIAVVTDCRPEAADGSVTILLRQASPEELALRLAFVKLIATSDGVTELGHHGPCTGGDETEPSAARRREYLN